MPGSAASGTPCIINNDLEWRDFKALLIMYLILLIQSLKMVSSKPKHVATYS